MFACVPFDRNGEKRDGGRGVGGGVGHYFSTVT